MEACEQQENETSMEVARDIFCRYFYIFSFSSIYFFFCLLALSVVAYPGGWFLLV